MDGYTCKMSLGTTITITKVQERGLSFHSLEYFTLLCIVPTSWTSLSTLFPSHWNPFYTNPKSSWDYPVSDATEPAIVEASAGFVSPSSPPWSFPFLQIDAVVCIRSQIGICCYDLWLQFLLFIPPLPIDALIALFFAESNPGDESEAKVLDFVLSRVFLSNISWIRSLSFSLGGARCPVFISGGTQFHDSKNKNGPKAVNYASSNPNFPVFF